MKKKLFFAAIAVCLIAVIACGSLAYFTASKSIKNSFYTAKSPEDPDPDPDEIFSIVVEETGKDGKPTQGPTNTYEDVLPGDKVAKDPIVKNTGSYDQFVRVNVTFDKADVWETALKAKVSSTKTKADLKDLLDVDTSKWEYATSTLSNGGKSITFTYYLKSKLAPTTDKVDNSVKVFTKVSIPEKFDKEQMAALQGFSINVQADAIQTKNTDGGKTGVEAAKYAFANYWN